jgi:hypothetical protein
MATCQVSPGDLNASGDNLYEPRSCQQDFIDWAWDAYDFDKEDWDHGFGWSVPCDVTRPLARTFNAVWCLEYSAADADDESYDKPILNWAGRFARDNIDELDGRCGSSPTTLATTFWGPLIDESTELYVPFFYGPTVPMRAAVLIHEARHANWVGHDSNGNDSSWGYDGAWRFEVSWLAWYARACRNATLALKASAVQRANAILDRNFVKDPGFRIGLSGITVKNAYFFKGSQYTRCDVVTKTKDPGYPASIAANWPGLWSDGIDAAVTWPTGKAYFFKGSEYMRCSLDTHAADPGYPRDIASNWPGLWSSGINAALVWPNGKAYFFKGSQYMRCDIATKTVDPGYPRDIASNWPGLWGSGIDAAVLWTNAKAYFFKGSLYMRCDVPTRTIDAGYPKDIAANWTGLFRNGIDAGIVWG